MRLADLVEAIHDAFDQRLAIDDVEAICAHDRYQASAGITAAAAYVAERAESAGLAGVQVLSFPADGAKRWWTYRAPTSWTPVRASLALDGAALVSYPEQAYRLAAYSAATPQPGRPLKVVRSSELRRDCRGARGALVVADEPIPFPVLAGLASALGASAVAADPLDAVAGRLPLQAGRLELPAGTGLAAFSLLPAELKALIAAADRGALVSVRIELSATEYPMPVVTGVLPGSGDREVLLSAHLCHPRPSANDNASGVAALLGAARVLATKLPATGRGARFGGVRFLWGPEFVGLAGYLHDYAVAGRTPVPAHVVNVDMAGEDVAQCGGPLVIERGPDDVPSFLPAIAERCAELLPPASRSYSGAVPCDPWPYRVTPFAGGSDHALAADRPVRSQAITLGHWPDRLNHSSADTPDRIDPAELRRTAVIAGALAAAIGTDLGDELAADLGAAVTSWAAGHVLGALPGRAPTRTGATMTGAPGATGTGATGQTRQTRTGASLDPRAAANAALLLRHRGAVATAAVRSLAGLGADGDWLDSAASWVRSLTELAATRLPESEAGGDQRLPGGPAVERCWEGPANLRAVSEAADPSDRDWLSTQLAQDRGGNYARALAMMRGVDGARDRAGVAWWAALSSELPIPVSFAESFADLLCRAGFVREPGGQP